ncbi:MAG: metalloregulator ArsR/SmtB family transcription factor [archaeon]
MNCNSYTFFNVISNKTRWEIINALNLKNMCVNDISQETKIEQSKVSHSLKVLSDCNVVFSKRSGKQMIYSLNKKTIKPILKILNEHQADFCKGKCKACKN